MVADHVSETSLEWRPLRDEQIEWVIFDLAGAMGADPTLVAQEVWAQSAAPVALAGYDPFLRCYGLMSMRPADQSAVLLGPAAASAAAEDTLLRVAREQGVQNLRVRVRRGAEPFEFRDLQADSPPSTTAAGLPVLNA